MGINSHPMNQQQAFPSSPVQEPTPRTELAKQRAKRVGTPTLREITAVTRLQPLSAIAQTEACGKASPQLTQLQTPPPSNPKPGRQQRPKSKLSKSTNKPPSIPNPAKAGKDQKTKKFSKVKQFPQPQPDGVTAAAMERFVRAFGSLCREHKLCLVADSGSVGGAALCVRRLDEKTVKATSATKLIDQSAALPETTLQLPLLPTPAVPSPLNPHPALEADDWFFQGAGIQHLQPQEKRRVLGMPTPLTSPLASIPSPVMEHPATTAPKSTTHEHPAFLLNEAAKATAAWVSPATPSGVGHGHPQTWNGAAPPISSHDKPYSAYPSAFRDQPTTTPAVADLLPTSSTWGALELHVIRTSGTGQDTNDSSVTYALTCQADRQAFYRMPLTSDLGHKEGGSSVLRKCLLVGGAVGTSDASMEQAMAAALRWISWQRWQNDLPASRSRISLALIPSGGLTVTPELTEIIREAGAMGVAVTTLEGGSGGSTPVTPAALAHELERLPHTLRAMRSSMHQHPSGAGFMVFQAAVNADLKGALTEMVLEELGRE